MIPTKPVAGIDDLWYYLNLGRVISLVKLAVSPCRSGNRFATIQYRCDWGKSYIYINHLHHHGVPTFFSLHDSKHSYFSVRPSQQRWVEYLLKVDDGNNVSGVRKLRGKTWNQKKTGKYGRSGKFINWFLQ